MRILFLKDDRYLPDLHAGVEVNTHFLTHALEARGHVVAVGACRGESDRVIADRACGYPVYRARSITAVALHALSHFRPDVVVCQNCVLGPMLVPRSGGPDVPTVYYEHSVPTAADPPVELRAQALVATNSSMLARHFRERFGVGSLVVPPIFGVDRYRGLSCRPRHVTMVSIQRRKGADLALLLAERRPDVPFVFVESWSEDEAGTRALKRRLATLPNVTIVPNRPVLSDILAGTRLLLMPSRSREAWGRMVTECQTLGIPALASGRGSLPRTVGDGGVTLDPDDDIALWGGAFDALWDDEARRARLGALAREHAGGVLRRLPRALRRFELLLQAARPQSWPGRVRLVEVPRADLDPVPVDRGDMVMMEKLQRQVAAVADADDAGLAALAREHAAPPSEATVRRIARFTGLPAEDEARPIAAQAAAHREEVVLQCLKGFSPAGWQPAIALVGRDHLDAALAAGRGAVLWVVHMVFAANVVKMALHRAGYRLSQLSRPEHGLSRTLFGRQCLNRVRTDFEDRFLVRRIRFDRARPTAAMLEARGVLTRNELLAVTAGAWEGTRFLEQPLLEDRLRLATGAPRLARLTGAALLPVSGVRLPDAVGFEVRIGRPIALPDGGEEEPALHQAFAQFAAHVAQNAIRYPDQWRGWSALADPDPRDGAADVPPARDHGAERWASRDASRDQPAAS